MDAFRFAYLSDLYAMEHEGKDASMLAINLEEINEEIEELMQQKEFIEELIKMEFYPEVLED